MCKKRFINFITKWSSGCTGRVSDDLLPRNHPLSQSGCPLTYFLQSSVSRNGCLMTYFPGIIHDTGWVPDILFPTRRVSDVLFPSVHSIQRVRSMTFRIHQVNKCIPFFSWIFLSLCSSNIERTISDCSWMKEVYKQRLRMGNATVETSEKIKCVFVLNLRTGNLCSVYWRVVNVCICLNKTEFSPAGICKNNGSWLLLFSSVAKLRDTVSKVVLSIEII